MWQNWYLKGYHTGSSTHGLVYITTTSLIFLSLLFLPDFPLSLSSALCMTIFSGPVFRLVYTSWIWVTCRFRALPVYKYLEKIRQHRRSWWQWCPEDILWLTYKELDFKSTGSEYDYILEKYKPVPSFKTGLAAYSAVCKRWQVFFERLIYRYLELTQESLYKISKISRAKDFIRHINFRIERKLYECAKCYGSWSNSQRVATYEKASALYLERLFGILSRWETDQSVANQKVSMEITIYSINLRGKKNNNPRLGINQRTLEVYELPGYRKSCCTTYRSLVEKQFQWLARSQHFHLNSPSITHDV